MNYVATHLYNIANKLVVLMVTDNYFTE